MTDKEAIERLKICVDCGDCLTCKAHDNAIELAIQALQEREERRKGCKNCTAGDGEFTVLLPKWGEDDFCPKCGRPLKEEV